MDFQGISIGTLLKFLLNINWIWNGFPLEFFWNFNWIFIGIAWYFIQISNGISNLISTEAVNDTNVLSVNHTQCIFVIDTISMTRMHIGQWHKCTLVNDTNAHWSMTRIHIGRWHECTLVNDTYAHWSITQMHIGQ